MSSFADFFHNALVAGVVTFLHEVKNEVAAGKLDKQTATADAVDSLLNAAFSGADALAAETPSAEGSKNANNTPENVPVNNALSQSDIVAKTAAIASESGDSSPQS
jgi:hypothetical protein